MFRTLALVLSAIALAAATYLARPTPAASPAGADVVGGSVVAEPVGRAERGEVERLVAAFEERIRDHTDALDYRFLGRLYLERARLSGDIDSYARADAALVKAVELSPDAEGLVLLGAARYAMHDFRGALELATRVLERDREQYAALLLAGDAALELGRYAEARAAYASLAKALPGTGAVEARLARSAYLSGDDQADRLAEAAEADAAGAGAFGAGLSWYAHLRAQLAFERGDYDGAAAHEERALAIAPDYHVAIAGLARARAAQGRGDEAISLYERAVAIVPQPDYLAALGDLRVQRGDPAGAARAYDTVEVIATLAQQRRVYDRQLALFYADHGRRLDRAVEIAAATLAERADIYGFDAYAWALHASGREAEARMASERALALGTPEARLLYHAGMISLALGDTGRARSELARALRLSPAFDPLQAERARDALAKIP